jgi:hypothetical protein
MQNFLTIVIFCIVLFFYLHIYFHLKTSDDLEVYEICNPSKDKLEEICDLRQPVIFDYSAGPDFNGGGELGEEMCMFRNNVDLEIVKQSYGAFDVKVKNIKDSQQPDSEPYIPLTLASAHRLMKSDTASKIISEKNIDFLEETGLVKQFQYSDEFLRPHMVSNCDYDYTFASEGVETPLQYSCCYRNYFMPIRGKASIVLIPPKSTKYLYAKTDYETFEFLSPVSPWNVQDRYKADYAKIKTLQVELVPGKIIFIPAYWWYSIKYANDTAVCVFKYRTYMNTIAIMPSLFLHFLQRQNIKRSTVKQVNAEVKSLPPAGGCQAPTTQCLNPLIVKEGYGEPLVPWTSSSPIAAEVEINDPSPSQNDIINNIMSGPVPVPGPLEEHQQEPGTFDSFQFTEPFSK